MKNFVTPFIKWDLHFLKIKHLIYNQVIYQQNRLYAYLIGNKKNKNVRFIILPPFAPLFHIFKNKYAQCAS